jgi:isopenicillin N synthase-like dioxygenase
MNLFKEQGVEDYAGAASQIPVIDFRPYFAAETGALERLAAELGDACENIGFFYALGHGVDEAIIDRAFAASRRFHALPLDQKFQLKLKRQQCRLPAGQCIGAGRFDRTQSDTAEPERELFHQPRSRCRPP